MARLLWFVTVVLSNELRDPTVKLESPRHGIVEHDVSGVVKANESVQGGKTETPAINGLRGMELQRESRENLSDASVDSARDQQVGVIDAEASNGSYLRWGYWIIIFYMFYAQATVCDHYFVESIKIIVDRFDIPEDVAGATLMALGCNGPELATNMIALFITFSDVGVGTIVGSEIFNLLTIIAGCALVAPVPMQINVIPFYRDSFFYALSIGLLMWVLSDGEVSNFEAWILLACGALFATTVASTRFIIEKLGIGLSMEQVVVIHVPVEGGASEGPSEPAGRKESRADSISVSRKMSDPRLNRTSTFFSKSELRGLMDNGEVEVTVVRHNRMADSHTGGTTHTALHRVTFEANGIYVDTSMFDFGPETSTDIAGSVSCSLSFGFRPKSAMELPHVAVSMACSSRSGSQAPSSARTPDSIRGVRPSPVDEPTAAPLWRAPAKKAMPKASAPRGGLSEPLLKGQIGAGQIGAQGRVGARGPMSETSASECSGSEMYVPDKPDASIKYSDIVRAHDFGKLDLQLDVRSHWGEVISVQMHSQNEEMIATYLKSLRAHGVKILEKEGAADVVAEILDDIVDTQTTPLQKVWTVLTFPVWFILAYSMTWCDPTNVTKQDRWFACFCMSMLWLAFFSYLMCWTSDQIHLAFGLSQTTLGVTLCAVGTSFPNFWASILMAKDGRSSMAVSNALGSNVQNVFLALALPWILRTAIPTVHSIPMASAGIFSGVMWMGGTLVLLLVIIALGSNTIYKTGSIIMLCTYAAYLLSVCA